MDSQPQDLVITLWFVTAADPQRVIAATPRADRGFGRKLLSQLNPRWSVTPIGQFALNRSAQVSPGEFYIAGFAGLSVIQTVVTGTTTLSALNARLRTAIPALDVYAFATNPATGFGGFAHWRAGTLKRSFCAEPQRVYEDIGLVEPFENQFWAGTTSSKHSGIALPFEPIALADEAQRYWLGFDVLTAPDINVVAYAIDGRPEPKIAQPKKPDVGQLSATASAQLGLGRTRRDYDDYEGVHEFDELIAETDFSQELQYIARTTMSRAKTRARKVGKKVSVTLGQLHERLRHIDQVTPPKRPEK